MRKKSAKKKTRGHYCRVCGRRRANEKYSGKGHAKHICKDCERRRRTEANQKRRIADSPRPADNLFADLPKGALPEELIENLVVSEHVRVERIISTGQSSPDDFWYDQEENEWIVVLRGSAALQFQGESKLRRLLCGDWVLIPAHQKHRVFSTASDRPTVWLAIFFKDSGSQELTFYRIPNPLNSPEAGPISAYSRSI